jgi:hypothetical protein
MHALTAAELLTVWERGGPLSAPRRALLLLAAACPEMTVEALARLAVGRRDELLLQLRASLFGPRLAAATTCARCGAELELAFLTDELLRTASPAQPAAALELSVEGHELSLRLPEAGDLVALADLPDAEAAEAALLERCVLSAHRGDRIVAAGELPEAVVTALASRLSEADPLAELRLALQCPACASNWGEALDVVTYFWREIEAWAARLLRDVHVLAQAYGWSEREVLELSPARRQRYLEMVS